MAPPSKTDIMKLANKELNREQVENLIKDYVKEDELKILTNCIVNGQISADQIEAMINGDYELQKVQKPDGSCSISMNFDLSHLRTGKFDGKLSNGILRKILCKETSDTARTHILKDIVPDEDIPLINKQIKSNKIDINQLEAIIKGNYKINKDMIHYTIPLEILKTKDGKFDSTQLEMILAGAYTPNQLEVMLGHEFTADEISAIFDSKITKEQLKSLLKGKYEVRRIEMEDGKGHIIELVYKKDSYKKYLQDIIDGKYPDEEVLKLFSDGLNLQEWNALKGMKLTVPQLHALICGNYVIERVDNPDGTYILNIVYKTGKGNITEIDEIGNAEDETGTSDHSKDVEMQQKMKVPEKSIDSDKTHVAQPKNEKPHEAPKKVKIPDLVHEKEWSIEQGSKLKVPQIFAADLKPNFYKKNVKHLKKEEIKPFYRPDKKPN